MSEYEWRVKALGDFLKDNCLTIHLEQDEGGTSMQVRDTDSDEEVMRSYTWIDGDDSQWVAP